MPLQELLPNIGTINVKVTSSVHKQQLLGNNDTHINNNRDLKSVASSLKQESSRLLVIQQQLYHNEAQYPPYQTHSSSFHRNQEKRGVQSAPQTPPNCNNQYQSVPQQSTFKQKQRSPIELVKSSRDGGSIMSRELMQQQLHLDAMQHSPHSLSHKSAKGSFHSRKGSSNMLCVEGIAKKTTTGPFGKRTSSMSSAGKAAAMPLKTPKFDGIQEQNPEGSPLLNPHLNMTASKRYSNDQAPPPNSGASSENQHRNHNQQTSGVNLKSFPDILSTHDDHQRNFNIGVDSYDFKDQMMLSKRQLMMIEDQLNTFNTNKNHLKTQPPVSQVNSVKYFPCEKYQKPHFVILMIRDGDWTYQVSSRDLEDLWKAKNNQKTEQNKTDREQSVTGMLKYVQTEKTQGYVKQNLRPGSTNSILKKLDHKNQQQKDEVKLFQNFFEDLKSRGQARIFRPHDKQPPGVIYSKDILNQYQLAHSLLQQEQLQSFNQPHLEIQSYPTAAAAIPNDESIDNNQMMMTYGEQLMMIYGQSCSPQTLYKKATNQHQPSVHQSSELDYMQMLGNPQNVDNFDGISHQGGATFKSNQENRGDTRNRMNFQTDGRQFPDQLHIEKRPLNSFRNANENLLNKSDDRPNSETLLLGERNNIGRRFVNIKNKSGSLGRQHLRQSQILSSYVESSKAPQMQHFMNPTLLNEDLPPGMFLQPHQPHNDKLMIDSIPLEDMLLNMNDAAEHANRMMENNSMMSNTMIMSPNERFQAKLNFMQDLTTAGKVMLMHHEQPSKNMHFFSPSKQQKKQTSQLTRLKSVRIQQFQMDLQDSLSSPDTFQINGGGKFSNTHIKMHIQSSQHLVPLRRPKTQQKQLVGGGYRKDLPKRTRSRFEYFELPNEQSHPQYFVEEHLQHHFNGGLNDDLMINTPVHEEQQSPSFDQQPFIDSPSKKNVLLSKNKSSDIEPIPPPLINLQDPHLLTLAEQEALLHNIIEETCESLDSQGQQVLLPFHEESQHTMKSNFNGILQPQQPLEGIVIVHKHPTRTYRGGSVTQQPPNHGVLIAEILNNHGELMQAPLTERRVIISNVTLDQRPSAMKEKRSISHVEIIQRQATQESAVHPSARSQGSPSRRQSASQQRNFDYMMSDHEQEKLVSIPAGATSNLQSVVAPSTMRVMSKLGAQQQNQMLDERANRQNQQQLVSGDGTRGTFPGVSSQGDFEALQQQARYESDSQLSQRNGQSKGDVLVRRLPSGQIGDSTFKQVGVKDNLNGGGTISKMMMPQIEMPSVEVIPGKNPGQTVTLTQGAIQTNSNFFNSNSQIVVKYSGEGDRRVVTSKEGRGRYHINIYRDLGLGTASHDDQQTKSAGAKSSKNDRKSYRLGTVVEYTADAQIGNLATEIDLKVQKPKNNRQNFVLDKKQQQMIKRNISFHRRANSKIKELRSGSSRLTNNPQIKPNKTRGILSSSNLADGVNDSQLNHSILGAIPMSSVLDPDLQFMTMNPSVMHLQHNMQALDQYCNSWIHSPHQMLPNNQMMSSSGQRDPLIEGGYGELAAPLGTSQGFYPQQQDLQQLNEGGNVIMKQISEQHNPATLGIKKEDSSTIKDESIYYPQSLHNLPQHLTTPKIIAGQQQSMLPSSFAHSSQALMEAGKLNVSQITGGGKQPPKHYIHFPLAAAQTAPMSPSGELRNGGPPPLEIAPHSKQLSNRQAHPVRINNFQIPPQQYSNNNMLMSYSSSSHTPIIHNNQHRRLKSSCQRSSSRGTTAPSSMTGLQSRRPSEYIAFGSALQPHIIRRSADYTSKMEGNTMINNRSSNKIIMQAKTAGRSSPRNQHLMVQGFPQHIMQFSVNQLQLLRSRPGTSASRIDPRRTPHII